MKNEPFFKAWIPLSPTTNQSYQRVNYKTKDKEIIKTIGATDELRQFKKDAPKALASQRNQQNWIIINDIIAKKRKRKQVPIVAEITFYLEHLWTSDIDGRVKASLDASCKHMGINDNLVVDMRVRKKLDKDNPRCEISITLEDAENYVLEKESMLAEVPIKKPTRTMTTTRAKKSDKATEKALSAMRKRGQALAPTVKYG